MSKERILGDADINIDFIALMAKEHLLEHGTHVPTVIAIGTHGKGTGQLEGDFGNHEERIRAMQVLGKVFRREEDIGRLQKIFFISEGWMSISGKPGSNVMRPSLDPNRMEVLIVSELDVRKVETSILLFEMVRDQDQNLTGVKPYLDESVIGGETKSYLLEAFRSGYYSEVATTNGKHLH